MIRLSPWCMHWDIITLRGIWMDREIERSTSILPNPRLHISRQLTPKLPKKKLLTDLTSLIFYVALYVQVVYCINWMVSFKIWNVFCERNEEKKEKYGTFGRKLKHPIRRNWSARTDKWGSHKLNWNRFWRLISLYTATSILSLVDLIHELIQS